MTFFIVLPSKISPSPFLGDSALLRSTKKSEDNQPNQAQASILPGDNRRHLAAKNRSKNRLSRQTIVLRTNMVNHDTEPYHSNVELSDVIFARNGDQYNQNRMYSQCSYLLFKEDFFPADWFTGGNGVVDTSVELPDVIDYNIRYEELALAAAGGWSFYNPPPYDQVSFQFHSSNKIHNDTQ